MSVYDCFLLSGFTFNFCMWTYLVWKAHVAAKQAQEHAFEVTSKHADLLVEITKKDFERVQAELLRRQRAAAEKHKRARGSK